MVPLLAPVITGVGDKSDIGTCLGNLRHVAHATQFYLLTHDNNYPFYPRTNAICTWNWAGKTNDPYWETAGGGAFHYLKSERPLNACFLQTSSQPKTCGEDVAGSSEVPVVRCPADSVSYMRYGQPVAMSTYDDVGTSYQWNMHALTDVDWNGDRNPWEHPGTWKEYGDLLIQDVLAAHAESFTFYLEGPMEWGLNDVYKSMSIEVGNHGDFGFHSAGYLDGHAEYRFFDTRRWCGPGWAAINPSWIRTWGNIPRPAHYYNWIGPNAKNCDP